MRIDADGRIMVSSIKEYEELILIVNDCCKRGFFQTQIMLRIAEENLKSHSFNSCRQREARAQAWASLVQHRLVIVRQAPNWRGFLISGYPLYDTFVLISRIVPQAEK